MEQAPNGISRPSSIYLAVVERSIDHIIGRLGRNHRPNMARFIGPFGVISVSTHKSFCPDLIRASLSQPGGICISQQAFDQIETKLDLKYEDLGDQRVKNIARPVHAYRIRLDGTQPRRAFFRKISRRNLPALGALLVLALVAVIGWQFWLAESSIAV
jgi:hypothetical protein